MMVAVTLPVHVCDSEKLARAIFEPFHIRNGKLKSAAFKAPAKRRDVSVNRLLALSLGECKEKARKIAGKNKVYKGFAIITAEAVRKNKSDVVDSRKPPMYLGHADIVHDVVLKRDEPAPPEFNRRLSQMAKAATFYPDPDPGAKQWTGEEAG